MQIGILVNNLESSQLIFESVKTLNSIAENHSVCLLYQNLSSCPFATNFAILNYNKIHSSYFDKNALLIATNVSSALDLSKVKNNSKKIFYAYELEFLDNKDFNKNYDAYNALPVFTRSVSYQKALKNYANIESIVVPFKIDEILWNLNTLKNNTKSKDAVLAK